LGDDGAADSKAGCGGGAWGVDHMQGAGAREKAEVFDEFAFGRHGLGSDARTSGLEVVLAYFGH
jgi:hypothetical protein